MASLPKEHVVKVRAELDNAAVVRPGDKLIVGMSRHIGMADAHALKDRFAEVLPGVEVLVVDSVSALAVYRNSDDTAATAALREIWEHLEQSDESFSAARLRRIIVEAGTFAGENGE